MKRFIVWSGVVVAALLCACTQSAIQLQAAGLQGAYDLALVNDLLFVTSTANDELRVLTLDADANKRGFVRAPNPIEPLSIPVLTRPQALAKDVRFVDGVAQPGPYVYARSNGSSVISVVAASRDVLREVLQLDTRQLTASQTDPGLRSTGPVTAFAALAPDPNVDGGPCTLYYSTQETTGPRLWRVRLNPDPGAVGDSTPTVERLAVTLPGDVAVSSLLVMPSPDTSEVLAVSTRRDIAISGGPALSYLVNLATGTVRGLDFQGQQVLQLATHDRVPGADGAPDLLAAGQRIFGVLDTSNCSTAPGSQCGLGVLAVDSTTGTVAVDPTGYPMLPLNYGVGLPTGLSLSTNTSLLRQGGETRDSSLPLLGIVPLSNGIILFFDALNLVQLNVTTWALDADSNELTNTATSSVMLADVQGNSTEASADLSVDGLKFGVTEDEVYLLTMEAVLPGMDELDRTADGGFEVPYPYDASKTPKPLLHEGDVIVLLPAGTGLQPCATDVTVASIQPGSSDATRVLVPAGPLPAACADFSRFQVRASGSQPLVLVGPSGATLARLGRGDTYAEGDLPYILHPPGYMGQRTAPGATLRYLRDTTSPDTRPGRGSVYTVTLQSHFAPYDISVDGVNVASLTAFRLPGAVVKARVGGDTGTDYAYIVYPSANGVLQLDLTNIAAGVANSLGLFPYL